MHITRGESRYLHCKALWGNDCPLKHCSTGLNIELRWTYTELSLNLQLRSVLLSFIVSFCSLLSRPVLCTQCVSAANQLPKNQLLQVEIVGCNCFCGRLDCFSPGSLVSHHWMINTEVYLSASSWKHCIHPNLKTLMSSSTAWYG